MTASSNFWLQDIPQQLAALDAANDQPSLDLLTQRLEVHEKTAWMLRSLLA
mgnify:CR=1 FL=1